MKRRQFSFHFALPQPEFAFDWRAWLPSRGNVLFTLVMIAVLLWAQSAGAVPFRTESAASTGTIAYQGRLANSAGAPITDTLSMSFRLYSAVTGGTPLWSEQWSGPNGVKVSDGLFNVMLGSLTPIAQSVITGNSNLFLGITVGTDDEMTPRVQLGSVPFAVQALTVPDGSITKAKLAADVSLVPPTGSITTTTIADGAVTDSKLNIYTLQTNGVGRFGVDNSDVLEGGQIELASVKDGPRWYFDNYNSHLRWFNCTNNSCTVPMMLAPNGNWSVIGTKSAIVTTGNYGDRRLYAVESPDVRFSDEGMGRLQTATARIQLDPIFMETIEGEFLIHLTPYSDALLYVSEVGDDYFVVTASQGDPNASFAWRLSATRKGYAGVRLEEVKGLDHEVAK